MKPTFDYSSVFKIGSHGLVSLVVSGLLVSVASAAPASNALPTGGAVVSGNVAIATNAATMNINQASSKSVINWNTYNIGSAATVNYNFAQAGSSSLNRVLSNNPSEIYGRLNANGKVILVNPNGIVFGSGSSVNVGSLVATTMNIKDTDYLNDKLVFTRDGSIGKVLNEGTITAEDKGYIALLAPEVVNKGVIKAVMGSVSMAAGEKIELTLDNSGLKTVILEPSTIKTLIDNKALIEAKGGVVYLGAKEANAILDTVMNLKNSGIVEATAMNNTEGKIILDGDNIEVDGTLKAAEVYAGNKNNAKTLVRATATLEGEFVETSGKVLGVENGAKIKAKTWLLDPTNIVVENGGTGDNIDADVVTTALNAGTDVTLEADNNILILESIITGNMANDATLLLKAGNNVVVGQYQSGTPVLIDATQNGNDNKLNVYISVSNALDNGRFELTGGSSIKTNGGDVIVGGSLTAGLPNTNNTATYQHGVTMYENVAIDAGAGNITIAGKGSGSGISMSETKLEGKDITIDAPEVELSISGITIESSGNAILKGDRVDISSGDIYNENGDWLGTRDTEIIANRVEITAGTSLSMRDAVIKVNDRATFSATAGEVNLGGTQVLFASTGILEVNAYSAGTRQDQIDSLISDWGASSESNLLELINDDEGTNYASMDAYFLDSNIRKPLFAGLKGGNYVTKVFSDGTPNTVNTSTLPILNNGLLAFGNGLEGSVNEFGMLRQPLYFDQTAGRWYKLTYSDYPLAAIIGVGGDGTNEWNLNGTIVSTIEDGSSAFSNPVFNLSGLTNGYGSIVATNTVIIDGQTLEMTNTYTLSSDKALIAMDTKLKNTSASGMENVRLWVGAQDDWIATSDETTKERGNLTNGSFVAIGDSAERAKALMITGSSSGVLFRTTSEKSNVFSKEDYGSDFYTQDPATSLVHIDESDGAYGVFTRFSNMTNGSNETIRWYYGAGSIADLSSLATAVSQQPSNSTGGSTTTPPSNQTPTTNSPVEVVVSQIADNVVKNVEKTIVAPQTTSPTVVAGASQVVTPPSVVQVVQPTNAEGSAAQGGAIVNTGGSTQILLAVAASANPFASNENISVLSGGVKVASAELPTDVKSDVKPAGIVGTAPASMVVVKQFAPQQGVELALVAPSTNTADSKVAAKVNTEAGSGFSFTVKEAVNVNVAQRDIKEVKATLDNGQALPAWLQFDAKTQTFKAVNPPANALPISTKVSITTKAGQTQQIAVEIAK